MKELGSFCKTKIHLQSNCIENQGFNFSNIIELKSMQYVYLCCMKF